MSKPLLQPQQQQQTVTSATAPPTAPSSTDLALATSDTASSSASVLTPSPLTGTLISNKQRKRAAKEQERQQLQELEDAQRLEVEALQSIHLDDIVILSTVPSVVPSKPPLPSSVSITVLPEPLLDRIANNHAVLTVQLSYPPLTIPPTPPSIELHVVRGVSSEVLAHLRQRMESEKQRMWAEDVRHDGIMVSLCGLLQEWLREHNVENVSFHEEMRRREQREQQDRAKEKREMEERAEREERERKEKLAMEIELANRRKERAMHEEKRQRQQLQQHHVAVHAKPTVSPAVSPLPVTTTVQRSSSEEKKEQPQERKPAAERVSSLSSSTSSAAMDDINARQLKAKLAKARQYDKKRLQKERNKQRSGKEHRTHIKDDDLSTSNPPLLAADDGDDDVDDSEESEDEDDEEEEDEEDEEKESGEEERRRRRRRMWRLCFHRRLV